MLINYYFVFKNYIYKLMIIEMLDKYEYKKIY